MSYALTQLSHAMDSSQSANTVSSSDIEERIERLRRHFLIEEAASKKKSKFFY
jgi:hypothetical protein